MRIEDILGWHRYPVRDASDDGRVLKPCDINIKMSRASNTPFGDHPTTSLALPLRYLVRCFHAFEGYKSEYLRNII